MWAVINRRRFLLGSAATLVQTAGGFSCEDTPAGEAPSAGADSVGFATYLRRRWPGVRLSQPVPSYGIDWTVLLPGGRALEGASAAVNVGVATVSDGRAVVDMRGRDNGAEFVRGRGRVLIVGGQTDIDQPRYFVMDARGHRTTSQQRQVHMPLAYELDDLTYGILWSATNIDDGLQADDQALSASQSALAAYRVLPASAVSREAAPGLTNVSQQWLGSDFCARHILRHIEDLAEEPVFWTREQYGEEASTWLLFSHKYDYLTRIQSRARQRLGRAFCIPEGSVRASEQHERILFFLAAALMESFDIEVRVTADPAYADVDGFVLGGTRSAIVANWVRSSGIWRVATTEDRSTLAEYADASRFATAHSVIAATSPHGRLQALADYLDLDPSWLSRRCRELATYGTAGLIRPRSRLISTEGLDAACAYVGGMFTAD